MLVQSQDRERTREFYCSCGKGYFSYAALFTHIKQKHSGKAPGPIIKPKPENKRGRPRKKQLLSSLKQDKYQSGLSISQISQSQNQINQNESLKNTLFALKSTPGSGFKSYKGDTIITQSYDQIQCWRCQQNPLLINLAHNLETLPCVDVSLQILQNFEAYQILKQSTATQQNLIGYLNRFVEFCATGIKKQYAGQIQLLILLLAQHILQMNKDHNKFLDMKSRDLNDYIQSFFCHLPQYIEKSKLSMFAIFQGLNPTKVLLVLYNWLGQGSIGESVCERSEFCNISQEDYMNKQ